MKNTPHWTPHPSYIPLKAVNNIVILILNDFRNIFCLLIQLNGQFDWSENLFKKLQAKTFFQKIIKFHRKENTGGPLKHFLNLTPYVLLVRELPKLWLKQTDILNEIHLGIILRRQISYLNDFWNFSLIYLRNFRISHREIDTLTRYDHLETLWHEKWLFWRLI